ncbi:hypothetical protein [Streptomyces sp. NPDC001927]
MTQTPASISAFTPRRLVLAAVALASLALTGCGSEVSGSAPQREPAKNVASTERPAQPSPEQAAFAAMLATYAQMCPPADGVPMAPPNKPEPVQSLPPGAMPPPEPIEPGPETALDRHEFCTSVHHEQRVIEALQKVAEPTPTKVRKTLNDLGYIDERIHGLKQEGKTTRFHLDLRENGSRLGEAGLAAGLETDVTPYVVPATGPFTVNSEVKPEGH